MVSIYPCDVHGRRIAGRLEGAYPSLVYRGSRRSRKLRVCASCLDSIFATYGGHWTKADIESDEAYDPVCGTCEASLETVAEPHAFFLTVYRRGQEREDWFGQYCPGCAMGLADNLALTA